MRPFVVLLVLALVAGGCGGDTEEALDTTASTPAATTTSTAPNTTTTPATTTTTTSTTMATTTTTEGPADWQIAIVSDSLANAWWPVEWADLIERDLGLTAEVLYHPYYGRVDYRAVLEDPEVRADLSEAELIFIPPEADYLREACEIGDVPCRDQAIEDYRVEWDEVLDEIRSINPTALLRSAKAWVWMAPVGNREGILAFMESAAEVTEEHGGLLVDLNTLFAGPELDGTSPNTWLDITGHPSVAGSTAIAETLHALGYDA